MKTKKTILLAAALLVLIAHTSVEAASLFCASQDASDSFRATHPLMVVFCNITGIFLLIGICASVFSVMAKDP